MPACPLKGLYANYELTEELGKGSFATVMKVMSKSTGKWYACKMILKKQLKVSGSQKGKGKLKDPEVALMKEVKILERLEHRNICQLREVFKDEHYISTCLTKIQRLNNLSRSTLMQISSWSIYQAVIFWTTFLLDMACVSL